MDTKPTVADLSRDLMIDLAYVDGAAEEARLIPGALIGPFTMAAMRRWPAAIRRAIAAEAECERLQHALERESDARANAEQVAALQAGADEVLEGDPD